MKKFLSIILAIALMLSMTACSLIGNEEDASKDAEKTVESFMDAFVDLDFEKLKDYVDDEDELPEEIRKFDMNKALDEAMSELPAGFEDYSDDFEGIFNDVVEKMKKDMSYKIVETVKDEDEDEYTVTVEITLPNAEDVDFEEVLGNSMDETALTDIVNEMVEEGKITAMTTEQEMIDMLMPKVFEIMKDVINDIEFETTTEEREFVVVKPEDDGEWVISVKKSDLE